ncbi:hypothetical protein [Gluconobacter morbifer]|uniref:Uncharacterized protein n=1 Tax=Gluconobacter morbifer G707 TaxID=1088869 RepID=G6XJ06_9PROT|nr:hypothetical protein [Gluconobacter morbifer]EHH68122.1 hypothetical protein GMO_14720 [Gluconobacter morbifer G707]
MKPIDLGQEVLSAQGTVLARSATRIGRRVAYGVVAAVFLLFTALSFHGFLWAFFIDVTHLSYVKSALCVVGIDFFFVIVFGLLAARSIADPVEIEARIRRDRLFIEFKQSLAVTALLGLVAGPAGRFTGRKVTAILKSFFTPRK